MLRVEENASVVVRPVDESLLFCGGVPDTVWASVPTMIGSPATKVEVNVVAVPDALPLTVVEPPVTVTVPGVEALMGLKIV